MAEIDLKTLAPDTSLPATGFLFGADSQASASPSVYSTQTVATTLLGSTTLSGATITADAPVLNMSQTWNNGAATFTGLKFNAAGSSDANSAAGSLLMDLQMGGSSRFSVNKSGHVSASRLIVTPLSNIAAIYLLNTSGVAQAGMFSGFGGVPVGFTLNNTGVISWDSSAAATTGTPDVLLTRRAAANLRLGAADAAAPVAQTLSVQSVVAGTSNTAGASLTITGSQGTGTGAGGSIVFQVAPAGSSGTAQNALVDALTINSARQLLSHFGSAGAPTYSFATVPNTGMYTGDGVLRFSVGGQVSLSVASTWLLIGGSGDAYIYRDAANTLALRNGTNAQTFNVYNTFTSSTNFERFRVFAQSAAAVLIGTEKGSGGGTAQALELQTDATSRLTLDTVGSARIVTALTVATLPGTPLAGMIARVTDALAPTIGMAVTGGGAAYALVNYNGANWTVIGV